MQVQTLNLHFIESPSPATSHNLVEALCSMPNLTDLTLKNLNEDFYSILKEKASIIQVQTLNLHFIESPSPATSHNLVEALCSMPNLTDLTLVGEVFTEEFFSTLKEKASVIQVKTLNLYFIEAPSPASSHHLVEALCSMPNLSNLVLSRNLIEEFYSTLRAKASSIQGCFPQIRNGNFTLNGEAQDDLNSFLHTLTCLQSGKKSEVPSTQSRAPLDDPGIPEKRPKYDV
ncbi:uncharacterized protein LOC105440620 [Strongylocentrotus purpuratus]|uniref:Uncharacterized protein n=1 Tax=Strongylocentrotus purpuratus TaxID=7668 RepID=A0A7M7ND47_STRPU|nr:uncharacterized protein LOC105440620 [Strongylocentrotus purpuratus]